MASKNIVLCFDGTWNVPNTQDTNPAEDHSTNVWRFHNSVLPGNAQNREQFRWYNEGVGTEWLNRVRGGAFGLRLDEHIKDGYRKLIENYREGDDIYLLGFSRGAYTARSLVGLIRNSGLLRAADRELIETAYANYRSKQDVDSEQAIAFRKAHSREVMIKFVGVWDTVGALGIPIRSAGEFNAHEYGFHDTKLSSIVQNAYHALAVDENREPYQATLWGPQEAKDQAKGQKVEQVWFSGAHADVGGGYLGEHPVADLSLRWMQQKASVCGLGLNMVAAPSEGSILACELHDSFREFLGGFFSMFSHRYYRAIGQASDGIQNAHQLVRKRVAARTDYRPKNTGLFDIGECADQ